jgi:transposase
LPWWVEIGEVAYASAASEAAPYAVQVADRFHVCKNLTEATRLLLTRCQAEIAAGNVQEPAPNESGQPITSIEQWRRHPSLPM